MKKTFLAALAALAMTLSAQAQAPAQRPAHGSQATEMHQQKGQHKMMDAQQKGQHKKLDAQQIALRKAQQCRQELRLDDKQYDKVFKAYKAFFQQLEQQKLAEGQQKSAEGQQKMAAGQQPDRKLMKAAKDKLSKQMQKVLSDVQFAEWQQLEQRQWHKAHPAGRDGATRHPAAQPGRDGATRHPAAQPGRGHGPQRMGARPDAKPDSVAGFHGNSRK